MSLGCKSFQVILILGLFGTSVFSDRCNERTRIANSIKFVGSYGSKSYYVGDNIELSWTSAWEFCRSHDMHLPSIESSMENQYVLKFLKAEAGEADWWLSGTDFAQEGKFIWMSTGREFSFLNWSTGNPNNANGGEHCVQIGTNVHPSWQNWNDNNCNSTFRVFCETLVK